MSLAFEGDGTITGFDPVSSGFGGLVAVKSVLKTDVFSASVAAGSNAEVTGLSITHALANSSNKLIISAYLGAASNTDAFVPVGLSVADDGTLIVIGDTAGSRTRVGAGTSVNDSAAAVNTASFPSLTFVYAPGDTASHTYTVRAVNVSTSTRTVLINRTEGDSDNAAYIRATSGFVIQEVSV